MKRIFKNISHVALALCLLPMIHSCSLMGSIDNIEQDYVITDETLITDASSAQQALNGVYAAWRDSKIAAFRSMLALSARTQGGSMLAGYDEFLAGNVQINNIAVENAYTAYYFVINEANSFIVNLNEKTTVPELSSERRQEMLAEARCMRALANLSLLRCFGEYYDQTSPYGICLFEDVLVRDNTPKARATVAETYTLIEKDLEFAIQYAPYTGEHYRMSPILAKALKCRVLMAKGAYRDAADLAREIIDEAGGYGFSLEPEYKDVFMNQFNSSEMLFAPYISYPNEVIEGSSWWMTTPGDLLTIIADNMVEDPVIEMEDDFEFPESDFEFPEFPGIDEPISAYDSRYTFEFVDFLPEATLMAGIYKYPYAQDGITDINSCYYMRLAEVYYICAEAAARAGDYPAARTVLAEVIARAGYDRSYVDAIPENELTGWVLKHKLVELNIENMEEWFDLVRYHLEGGFEGWTEEELAALPEFRRLLLPIPRNSMGSNSLLVQNPEYQ